MSSEQSGSDQKPSIHLSPCREFFVWDATGMGTLRRKCRVVGKAIGCLPRGPRQSNLLGLPILLSLEEAVLILWKDLGEFFIDKPIHDEGVDPLDETKLNDLKRLNIQNHKEISEVVSGQRRMQRVGHYHQIVAGKKKRKERLLKKRERGEPVSDQDLAECEEEFVDLQTMPGPSLELGDVPIHIPAATPQILTRPGEMTSLSRQELSLAESFDLLWQLLESDETQYQKSLLRCRIFCDLWSRGYFVTVSTFKMAGDFLIYQGDPVTHHASHIVLIQDNSPISVHQLSSNLRVASSVRKVLLIVSDQDGDLKYTSLNWTGV